MENLEDQANSEETKLTPRQTAAAAKVEEAINNLPYEQRVAVLLRTNENMSSEEIAQTLGDDETHCDEGMVEQYLSDAEVAIRAYVRA